MRRILVAFVMVACGGMFKGKPSRRSAPDWYSNTAAARYAGAAEGYLASGVADCKAAPTADLRGFCDNTCDGITDLSIKKFCTSDCDGIPDADLKVFCKLEKISYARYAGTLSRGPITEKECLAIKKFPMSRACFSTLAWWNTERPSGGGGSGTYTAEPDEDCVPRGQEKGGRDVCCSGKTRYIGMKVVCCDQGDSDDCG